MKELGTFETTLQDDSSDVALAIIITLLDGTIYRFTDNSQDVIYDGNTYTRNFFILSSVQTSLGIITPNCSIGQVAFDAAVLKQFRKADKLTGALVEVIYLNVADTDEVYILFKGTVENAPISDFSVDLSCQGLYSKLFQDISFVYSNECYLEFGSELCGVDPTLLEETGTVTDLISQMSFKDSGLGSFVDGYFTYGLLEFTSGLNNGIAREVKTYGSVEKQFTMFTPFPFAIAVTDAYKVYRGCKKTKAECDFFNNFDKFRGYSILIPNPEDLVVDPDASE